jgi:phosphatidate cytidylyltransferase
MLIQRIATALVLLGILLPALFFGSPDIFNALALILIAAGVWEWSKMNGFSASMSITFGIIAFLFCTGLMLLGVTKLSMPLFWLSITAIWVLVSAILIHLGVPVWSTIPKSIRQLLGVFLICAAWLAVAQLREIGINLLLSVLLLVWAADVMAYAAGRLWGRRKLAALISPGKTLEGVAGGFLGVIVIFGFWLWLDQRYLLGSLSFYSLILDRFGLACLLVLAFFTAMAVVGDLIESLVKRSAGVKDSSALLPGHGGVLDRVDALLPVLPAAMLLVSYR